MSSTLSSSESKYNKKSTPNVRTLSDKQDDSSFERINTLKLLYEKSSQKHLELNSINKTITISCNCCETILTFPISILRIKCLSCNTYFTLDDDFNHSPSSPQPFIFNSNIPLASYISLKQAINKDEIYIKSLNISNNDEIINKLYKNVDDLLENSFTNLSIINKCFLLNLEKKISYNSPNLNFIEIKNFYNLLLNLPTKRPIFKLLTYFLYLLKHPPMNINFNQLNWLLIILEIPLLYESLIGKNSLSSHFNDICYDITKRIIGLLNSIDNNTRKYLIHWWSRLPINEFVHKINFINLYITFHINRLYTHLLIDKIQGSNKILNLKDTEDDINFKNNLKLKYLKNLNQNHDNSLLNSLGLLNNSNKKFKNLKISINFYSECWHLRTASKVMTLLFIANKSKHGTKIDDSCFYNTLIDYINVKQDYDIWQFNNSFIEHEKNINLNPENFTTDLLLMEQNKTYLGITISNGVYKRSQFTLCNHPFLISLGSKISILEHDAKRVMGLKAEQAFISSIIEGNKLNDNIYCKLIIRRNYITLDSLRQIQNHPNDLKKILKIEFVNEPGIDAGGLKKEWFLLLTKELFDSNKGLITYNNESNMAYFAIFNNQNYNHELFYLLGVIIGMAIYNSIILDIKFPKVIYNKLLGHHTTIDDLSEIEPSLSKNLKKLSKMKNIEDLNLNFEISIQDNNKEIKKYDLIPDGSNITVTDSNKLEYINKYYKFLLDDIVDIQFSQFSKGFKSIMGSNVLSLFSPSEIQKLIIGDDNLSETSKYDIEILKSITKFNNCSNNDPIIIWFWNYFSNLSLVDQRKLMRFITGSDRIPATGLTSIQFKVTKLIDNSNKTTERLPISHTCFNEICLWQYRSKEVLKQKLDLAINESEGFALR